MGDQPVAHDESGYRGPQPISCRVDVGPIQKSRKEVPVVLWGCRHRLIIVYLSACPSAFMVCLSVRLQTLSLVFSFPRQTIMSLISSS